MAGKIEYTFINGILKTVKEPNNKTQVCIACEKEKHLKFFNYDKTRRRYRTICNDCRLAEGKAYHQLMKYRKLTEDQRMKFRCKGCGNVRDLRIRDEICASCQKKGKGQIKEESSFRTIKAVYEGMCAECSEDIHIGDNCYYDIKTGKVYCMIHEMK